ncbi:hypothetical protein CKA32_005593 [Geitlerinema sp. FC II]|nr:hypothetical protein CKA32_005593 [Geitlerinema sp. FC II]
MPVDSVITAFQSLEGIFGFFNILREIFLTTEFAFQSLEGIFGFFNRESVETDEEVTLVSIPRRDFWFFQLKTCTFPSAIARFQSLEGIFGFFNAIFRALTSRFGLRFQSLEGIFGFFNFYVAFFTQSLI